MEQKTPFGVKHTYNTNVSPQFQFSPPLSLVIVTTSVLRSSAVLFETETAKETVFTGEAINILDAVCLANVMPPARSSRNENAMQFKLGFGRIKSIPSAKGLQCNKH